MSNTIKQAILSLKSRIADAYTAIAAKGGTLPATQDSASLPEAIESIPGKGDYDIISGIRLSDDPSDPSAPTRPLPDGMSLVQLLCTSILSSVTEIVDGSSYTITNPFPISAFPNLDTVTFGDNVDLGISTIISGFAYDVLTVHGLRKQATQSAFNMFEGSFKKLYCDIREIDGAGILINHAKIEEMYLPKLEKANCIISWYGSGWWNNCSPNITTIQAPKLKEVTANYGTGINAYVYKACLIGAQCPLIKSLEFKSLESISGNLLGGGSCPNIEELRMPKLKRVTGNIVYNVFQNKRASLALIEVGAMETNLGLSWWNPTDKGANFLSNFQTYIADRVADRTGQTALRLTLSAAVYEALQAQEDQTILATLTNKNWTVASA